MTDTVFASLHPWLGQKELQIDSRVRVLIIAPVYNESEIIETFIRSLNSLRKELAQEFDLRLLVVDDGSTDDTFEKILLSSHRNEWLGYVKLVRNFGHQAALVAGLSSYEGWAQAVVTMDGDMEHPMEAVRRMIRLWKETECQIVSTIRLDHKELSFFKRFCSKSFYRLIALTTGIKISPGQADFTLWDARLLLATKKYLSGVGPLRVFTAWLPVKKETLYYKQHYNPNRKSRFTFRQNLNLTISSLVRYSDLPLQMVVLIGFLSLSIPIFQLLGMMEFSDRGHVLVTILHGISIVLLGMIGNFFRRMLFTKNFPIFLLTNPKATKRKP
jgi:dolichol-phosphate mannosyltransferase